MKSFSDFGLSSSILKTLKEKRLQKPTEIQSQAIPLLMSGQSVVGISETGSGKTLTYALPLLNLLKGLETEGKPVQDERTPRALIMAPTRELGEQIARVFKTFTHDTRLRVRAALGGTNLEQARKNTSGQFEILLATPGRLVQMIERDLIHLNDVRVLIFDEADQMMDQGFLGDSQTIAETCPKNVQLALFSATISPNVQELMTKVFSDAEVVRTHGSGKVVASLVTKHLRVEDGERWPVLEKVLKTDVEGGTMLFTNTREQCDKLAKLMTENGYECLVYRGDMDKNERRLNLKKFRDGKIKFLVSTDIAGRGLDVESVGRVINYHLPKQMENYLHRAGRTARAGRKGLVVNLVTERDLRLVSKLEGPIPHFPKKTPEKKAAYIAAAKAVKAQAHQKANRKAPKERKYPAPKGNQSSAPQGRRGPAAKRGKRPSR